MVANEVGIYVDIYPTVIMLIIKLKNNESNFKKITVISLIKKLGTRGEILFTYLLKTLLITVKNKKYEKELCTYCR